MFSRSEDGEAAVRPGQEEADQRPRHRGGGGCGADQEDLQPAPALHAGEGQECGHPQGLLFRPGAHRQGPPRVQVDPDPATLL